MPTITLLLLHLLTIRPGIVCFEERMEHCCADLRENLCNLNCEIVNRVNGYLESAITNLAAGIRYQYLESHGPCKKKVTISDPLFPRLVFIFGVMHGFN